MSTERTERIGHHRKPSWLRQPNTKPKTRK